MTLSAASLMRILESLYQVEQDRDAWLRGVVEAAAPTLAGDAGIGGILYAITGDAELRLDSLQGQGISRGWLQAGVEMYSDPHMVPSIVGGYRSILCASMNEAFADPYMRDHYAGAQKVRGQIIMNGADGSGHGCAIHLFSSRPTVLSEARRDFLSRIATHLATAYRLQRRLSASADPAAAGVEAVLTPEGRVEHAEGEAKEIPARQELTVAVRQRETRRRAGASHPEETLRTWKGLVAARWTLVDRYERGGRRYVLARENAPAPLGPATLSTRERQVAALAAIGRSNKLISYELGLAHSTVRVLISRACAKLAVTSRAELVSRLALTPPM